jgi:membrane protease YdiL (CAAX protease family)
MTRSTPHLKRETGLFLAVVFLLSATLYGLLYLRPEAREQWGAYSLAFMWCPGLAAIVAQLAARRSLRGLGWGWGGLRYYLLAYGLPIAFCLAAYLPVWLGLDAFRPQAVHESMLKLSLPAGVPGYIALTLFVLAQPFLGMIASLGEELGWRGFLFPRLYTLMGFTKASFITGAIWSVWHFPVVIAIFPLYRPGVSIAYALACFSVAVVAISFVHSWLRLRSGSMWPSTLLHASSNAFLASFQALTRENRATSYLTFEYGLGLAVVMLPVGYAFWRQWRKREEQDGIRAAYVTS